MQLLPDGARGPRTVSVSALNAHVRQLLENGVPALWVEGEVTGWKRHSSGHCYFSIRDAGAQVSAVMFRSDAQRLPADPEEGMQVRVYATVSLYERRGDFQLLVRRVDATGAGGLWRIAFERLRRQLEAEGLLAPERKRTLPRHPRVVGVVTSPVGAVLHDILHVIRRRAPWTHVILAPARVQGEGASQDVARAVQLLQRSPVPVDVIIVARGGGAVEDLWAFNEEPAARAIAGAAVPVISAVGHEVDVTIADLVADVRAPTPSAAAEYAVPDGMALRTELDLAGNRLGRALHRYATRQRDTLQLARERLTARMQRLIDLRRRSLESGAERLRGRMQRQLERQRAAVGALAGRLEALSPLHALARGYALPLAADGRVLRRVAELPPGTRFSLRVTDGAVPCTVDDGDVP
jgi:exodeoxyribonuclease VII large subunit